MGCRRRGCGSARGGASGRGVRRRAMSSGNGAGPEHITSYHGQPVLKEPVWTWEIPVYFYTGGLAGASAGLAWLSDVRGNETLSRRAWAAAGAGIMISPAFLISDLGK